MPSFVEIGYPVPETKSFEGFLPYMGMTAILGMVYRKENGEKNKDQKMEWREERRTVSPCWKINCNRC